MKTIKDLHTVHPGIFRKNLFGKEEILYTDSNNPYETVEVYILLQDGLLLGTYISEHDPDGCSSWSLINLNEESFGMLRALLAREYHESDVVRFLKDKFYNQKIYDSADFTKLLKKYAIPYEEKRYF